MLASVLVVLLACSSSVLSDAGISRDVDVFNKNFNRKQHNARDLVYRVYEVIPPRPEPTWKVLLCFSVELRNNLIAMQESFSDSFK